MKNPDLMQYLKRVFSFEAQISNPIENFYIESYQHMVAYFENVSELKVGNVVAGAHMIYGWMPTIVRLDKGRNGAGKAVAILQTVKEGGEVLSEDDLSVLKQYINNSIIGTSKMLHFIDPEKYPIWDSKMYEFMYDKSPSNYQVNNVRTYLAYRSALLEMTKHSNFPKFHESVNTKIGYPVSELRALELVMFLSIKHSDGVAKKGSL